METANGLIPEDHPALRLMIELHFLMGFFDLAGALRAWLPDRASALAKRDSETDEWIRGFRVRLRHGWDTCERCLAALHRGGAIPLDEALNPGLRTCSVDLGDKLFAATELFRKVMLDVGNPAVRLEEHLQIWEELQSSLSSYRNRIWTVINQPSTSRSEGSEDTESTGELVGSSARGRLGRKPSVIAGTETDWKVVQGLLLAKRGRSEPFTSGRALAKELGCAESTIRKAIERSDILKGWRSRSRGAKGAPKASTLDAATLGREVQSTELAPDSFLPDDDVDATMDRLIAQAKPAEREKLTALDSTGRRKMAALVLQHERDTEPSPLGTNQLGKGPPKPRQYKRA